MAQTKLYDLAWMTTTTTGTGTITLGAAVSGANTFAQAGVQDGDTVRYCIRDGANSEVGTGVYTASGTTLTRNVVKSTNSNALINLSGAAQVFIGPTAEDFTDAIVRVDNSPGFTAAQQSTGRANIYAAPLDAMAPQNLLINSRMLIAQEFVTTGTGNLSASGTYTTKYPLDQWAVGYRGTFVFAAVQAADAPAGFVNSLKLTFSTAQASLGANDECSIIQPIEGNNTSRLAFGTANAVTSQLVFWVKAHRTGTYSGAVRSTVIGGASARSYPFNFTVNVADTWEMKTVSIPGDTTGTSWGTGANAGAFLVITVGAGSSRVSSVNTWGNTDASGATGTINGLAATTDVFQLGPSFWWPGLDVPTTTDVIRLQKSFGDDFADCQRFFQKTFPYTTLPGDNKGIVGSLVSNTGTFSSSVAVAMSWRFQRAMRAAPTMTTYNPQSSTAGNIGDYFGNASNYPPGSANASETSVSWANATGAGTSLTPCMHAVARAQLTV